MNLMYFKGNYLGHSFLIKICLEMAHCTVDVYFKNVFDPLYVVISKILSKHIVLLAHCTADEQNSTKLKKVRAFSSINPLYANSFQLQGDKPIQKPFKRALQFREFY